MAADTAPKTPRRELYLALAEARMRGLRQWQVAAAAGIDPSTLSRIVTRERDPRGAQAAALAAVLGTGVAQLFPDLNGEDPGHDTEVSTEYSTAGQSHRGQS